MKIGVVIRQRLNNDAAEEFAKAAELGFETCQLIIWDEKLLTNEFALYCKAQAEKYHIEISAFWCGWQKPVAWNFYEGQLTLGLVPPAYRFARSQMLCKGSDFAKLLGVKCIVTHAGYMPENPYDENYAGTITALKHIALHCKENGQHFLFETGQETPTTLKRVITDVGTDNLGINLDPANLLMYGKANPVDSLDIFGEFVMGVHAKDGEYPTDGKSLGLEKAIGEGRVNFPLFIEKLKKIGYNGAITIEREISGEKQISDIVRGKAFLETLI
jgi:sugar phosphate isomerase/epimerase